MLPSGLEIVENNNILSFTIYIIRVKMYFGIVVLNSKWIGLV